jgi:uncharacterized membrane protein
MPGMKIKASAFFSRDQQEQMLEAIREAERESSGEIRIHIETSCKEETLDRAAWIFSKIGMDRTAERNGVLFYLAITEKKFAVIGDRGINSVVHPGFWDEVISLLKIHFSEGRFTDGLREGILLAGRQMKEHFPGKSDDVNELPDSISFDSPEIV